MFEETIRFEGVVVFMKALPGVTVISFLLWNLEKMLYLVHINCLVCVFNQLYFSLLSYLN